MEILIQNFNKEKIKDIVINLNQHQAIETQVLLLKRLQSDDINNAQTIDVYTMPRLVLYNFYPLLRMIPNHCSKHYKKMVLEGIFNSFRQQS